MTTITIDRKVLEQALNALLLPCDRWNGKQFLIVNAAVNSVQNALAAPATAPDERIKELEAENNNLRTVMMAAAVEIQEHWNAHCDEDGYGPANLVRRLEHGYPAQYGYNAETVVRLRAKNEQLRKDAERYQWLAEYLVSDDESYDDAIVAATTVKEVDSVIDNAMKGTS